MNRSESKLVEMHYFRKSNPECIKSAIVTEKQSYDIKVLLHHIRVVNVKPTPIGSKRDYMLV